MKISAKGITLLKEREGERLTAYKDGSGVWTIGVGHTGPEVQSGSTISAETSAELFGRDMLRAEEAVNSVVKVRLSQDQFDALVSFTFNVGVAAFKKSSLLRELNKSNYEAVPHQLQRWNKITVNGKKVVSNGLINRRLSESAQWSTFLGVVATSTAGPAEPEGRTVKSLVTGSRQTQVGVLGATAALIPIVKEQFSEITSMVAILPNINSALPYIFVGVCVFVVLRRYTDARSGRAY